MTDPPARARPAEALKFRLFRAVRSYYALSSLEAAELFGISERSARRHLTDLYKRGKLRASYKQGKRVYYTLPSLRG